MANSFSGRQWTIDTPFTVTPGTPGVPPVITPGGAAPADLMMSEIKIHHIEFTDYTAVSQTGFVLDRVGRVIWHARGDAGLEPVRSGTIGWVEGLQVPSIGGGQLTVFIA